MVYILSVLDSCLLTEGLFPKGESQSKQGGSPTIAESFLQAIQEEQISKRKKNLKQLGETILVKSGFFAESLNRKIVGLNYYIQMGQSVYMSLYETSQNPVYEDLSDRFSGYVDLFSKVGLKIKFKNQEDVLVLFEKYLNTDSKSAYKDLIDLGIVPADSKKASNQ